MKKIIISLAALAALSTGAFAQRNYDISSPPYGETQLMKGHAAGNSDVRLFAVPQMTVKHQTNYDNNIRDNIGRNG